MQVRECRVNEGLVTFCNPPATVNLHILVVITDVVADGDILTIVVHHHIGNGISDARGVCGILEVNGMLAVDMEALFRPHTETVVVADEILYVVEFCSHLAAMNDTDVDVGTEDLGVVGLVVLVALGGVANLEVTYGFNVFH